MVNTRKIVGRRGELGYNQKQVAEAIGIRSVGSYSSKERGRTPFTAEEWIKLCDFLEWGLEESRSYFLCV